MIFENVIENLHDVLRRIENYVLSKAEYYKLRLFKSVMKTIIPMVNLLVFGSLFLFVLLFLSIGAAFWIGSLLDQVFIGFIIVGGFYAFIFLLMLLVGRRIIRRKLLRAFSSLLFDENKEMHENPED